MNLAKKNTKKLIDEVEKREHFPNIGIRVSKNPKIDYYCDNCQGPISHSQYKNGKGLCKSCI
jgi:hypothetical protein